jgi:hypothetical protein
VRPLPPPPLSGSGGAGAATAPSPLGAMAATTPWTEADRQSPEDGAQAPAPAPVAHEPSLSQIDFLMDQGRWSEAVAMLDGLVAGAGEEHAVCLRQARALIVDGLSAKALRLIESTALSRLSAADQRLREDLLGEARRQSAGSTSRLTRE